MRLVEPTVKMCKEGIRVSWTAGQKLRFWAARMFHFFRSVIKNKFTV